ncbi:glycosyltransferase [Cohnella zeiphila]|uniref:Glycosyltransferase n=1 Tax=Cohnella zeiphila TaxID=2761120 RepID=A0A7X0SP07_9BACL|nr:glycosyltransferase [Cohnella zeiphila]MBB6732240.1 glycosyltransferase [Cohnella zeiphila]
MQMPLVSIVIPVYNGANYMREAIDSALAQTYPNIEVIIVNDGSKDEGETERIALSYGDRIRYLHKNNGGVATALNYAIEEMKGDYFSWLSHDDLYYPQKVEKQIEALQNSGNERSIVLSDVDFMETDVVTTQLKLSNMHTVEQLQNSVFPVIEGLIHGCSLLIHKSHFERVGQFDESLITTQDYDLWFRMFRYERLLYVPESLIIGRLHPDQGSRTIPQHQTERNQLYIGFIEQLTELEMNQMYGSAYRFYARISQFLQANKLYAAYQYSNARLQEEEVPDYAYVDIHKLKLHLMRITNGCTDRICIFGAGVYGRRLLHLLQGRLVQIDCFCDNNTEKWKTFIEGLECISLDRLVEMRNRTLVIVANETPEPIVQQLKSLGFHFLTTKQELDSVLSEISPLKWVSAFDGLEGVEYTINDVKLLISQFKKVIIDMGNQMLLRIPNHCENNSL